MKLSCGLLVSVFCLSLRQFFYVVVKTSSMFLPNSPNFFHYRIFKHIYSSINPIVKGCQQENLFILLYASYILIAKKSINLKLPAPNAREDLP
jgi:hypothetical protein